LNQLSAAQSDQVPIAFLDLMNTKKIFPLVVEGKNVLPHESTVVSIDINAKRAVLKTFRPMPTQLSPGTPSIVSIAAFGEHWKARLIFQGRVGYLQYLFDLPETMQRTARRRHKRYPFRPKEKISVYAQDATLPSVAAVGVLLDLSVGGMLFRPERVFRVEDSVALKFDSAMFYRGKSFPLIRIDGLPGLETPLQLHGEVAHALKRGKDINVAFAFGVLDNSTTETISRILTARK